MSNDHIRCLSHPDRVVWPQTSVVPRGHGMAGAETRSTLGQFLQAVLMKPLFFNDEQQQHQIEDALDTMTWAERIAIEIEMQSRHVAVHSFDYDPLR